MKRISLSVALLVTLLSLSCSKTGLAPDQAADVSTTATAGARQTYTVVALPSSTLPANVKTYLDLNQAGYTLIQVEKRFQPGSTTAVGTKVKILRDGLLSDLFFDTNGALTGRPAGPRGEVTTSLTAAQLPTSASTYLSQTYAGYKLLSAESVHLNGAVQEYRVQILTNSQRIDVHFDGTGTFRDAHTAPAPATTSHSISFVAKSALPAAITTALTNSYSAYTYGWTELHVHDGVTVYDVKLFSNNQPTVLHFDTSGNLVAPVAPGAGGPMSGTTVGGPVSGTVAGPKSGTAVGGPVSGTIAGPKSGTAAGGPPAPGMPGGPKSGTMTPGMPGNHQLILNASSLPAAITSYLQANFSGYTFLAADLNTPPAATSGEYMVDIAVGSQLYKVRFTAAGEVLMAEARI